MVLGIFWRVCQQSPNFLISNNDTINLGCKPSNFSDPSFQYLNFKSVTHEAWNFE